MGKLVLAEVSPEIGAWLRYMAAALSYFAGIAVFARLRRVRLRRRDFFCWPALRRDRILIVLLGFFAFCYSPLMQMTGLASSRAVESALIIAMEPLMTVFLARVVLGERLSSAQFLVFAVALFGFALLSGLGPSRVPEGWDPHALGNFLLLFSLAGEALYSILGRKLIDGNSPVAVFGTALAVGASLLTVATVLLKGIPAAAELSLSPRALLALFWLGPLGTTASYCFWIMVLKEAPVASLALTLFIQPVFGALWGTLFLQERLAAYQWFGGGLILVAVVLESATDFWRSRVRLRDSLRQII